MSVKPVPSLHLVTCQATGPTPSRLAEPLFPQTSLLSLYCENQAVPRLLLAVSLTSAMKSGSQGKP